MTFYPGTGWAAAPAGHGGTPPRPPRYLVVRSPSMHRHLRFLTISSSGSLSALFNWDLLRLPQIQDPRVHQFLPRLALVLPHSQSTPLSPLRHMSSSLAPHHSPPKLKKQDLPPPAAEAEEWWQSESSPRPLLTLLIGRHPRPLPRVAYLSCSACSLLAPRGPPSVFTVSSSRFWLKETESRVKQQAAALNPGRRCAAGGV